MSKNIAKNFKRTVKLKTTLNRESTIFSIIKHIFFETILLRLELASDELLKYVT